MKDIAIYGCGGFGREVACLIERINEVEPQWNFIGFYGDVHEKGFMTDMGPVIGNADDLNAIDKPLAIAIANGSPKSIKVMREKVVNKNIEFPNLIDPSTVFLKRELVKMGEGNIMTSYCCVSVSIEIGSFNVFNGYIGIGHDAKIGSFNVFMPAVRISGAIEIGDNNFFGLESAILQGKKVGNNTRIGAGSIVMRNTKDDNLYMGIPAKKI